MLLPTHYSPKKMANSVPHIPVEVDRFCFTTNSGENMKSLRMPSHDITHAEGCLPWCTSLYPLLN